MKLKTTYILLAGLAISLLASCKKQIEGLEPKNSVTFYNAFKTEADIERALIGMERDFRDHYTSASTRPAFLGEKTDKTLGDIKAEIDWSPSIITPNYSEADWRRFYSTIGYANIIIENIGKISNLPTERKNYYLGQAYFMRAFLYFHMMRIWRDVPIVTSTTDVLQLAKSSMNEVLTFATKDANAAAAMLKPWSQLKDSQGNAITSKQIAGQGAAWGLLSHIHAWRAEVGNQPAYLDSAINNANKCINSGEFALVADPETVITQVRIGNTSEGVFEGDVNLDPLEISKPTAFITTERLYQGWPFNPRASKNGYKNNSFGLKSTTVDALFAAGDKRKDAYFYQFDALKNDPQLAGWAVVQTRRQALISEPFPGFQQFTNWKGNAIIFSFADIILLRAECLAKKGNNALAIADINTIRTRAGAPLYQPSEGDVFTAVFNEREKEFLFQRVRWFDCVRTGFWKTKLSPIFSTLTQTDIDNGALYLPVGIAAFQNNPLMRQNTYWLSKY